MLKLVILAIIIIGAIVAGIISYDDEKLIVDTAKGKQIVEKTTSFVQDKLDK